MQNAMVIFAILIGWSVMGITWWFIAWYLMAPSRYPIARKSGEHDSTSLSIFKPLPLLGDRGLTIEAPGLESFILQLDEKSELLLGAHEADRDSITPFIEEMQKKYPHVRLQIIYNHSDETRINPKVAWQKILMRYAQGDLWLWSDADIVVPSDFLQRARREFAAGEARMLTFPYAARRTPTGLTLFDTLFVNVEFLPGVLLLRRLGFVDFGLGAAMLFKKEDFLQQADWGRLDRSLADDFVLGQLLKPVAIGSIIVSTEADSRDWKTALGHYIRWVKTIRWCRPLGYAAQIFITPMVGWLVYIGLNPFSWVAWVGFSGVILLDVFFAARMCARVGCSLSLRHGFLMPLWSIGRGLSWVLCWLPFPVMWRTQTWWSAHLRLEEIPRKPLPHFDVS